MEASNLPETEFKTMVIKMLKELRGRKGGLNENLNRNGKHKKGHRNQKKKQSEKKHTITEMNTLEGINSRLNEAED